MKSPRRQVPVIATWIGLAFLVAVLYGRTTTFSFVWDDKALIAQNKVLPLAGVADLFSDFWKNAEFGFESGYFRPLTTLTFFLDFKMYGENAWGYHLTNVILYWLTCGFVFLFFRRLLDDSPSALIGTLVFTLHPLHVEPVAFVSSRTDLLAALLVLAAYLVGTRPRGKLSWFPPVGAAVLFFLALMAKEASVPLLLFAPFFAPREYRKSLFLALLAGTAAAVALRFAALSSVIPAAIPQKAPLALRLLTVPAVAIYYLKVIFFPFNLSALPALEWVTSPAEPRFFLPLLALAGVAGGLLASKRRFPLVWVGAAWGALFLLPVLQIIQTTMRAAERFAFLPSAGFVLAATVVFREAMFSRDTKIRRGSRVLVAALLTVFAAATATRVPVWKNSSTLWEATAKREPGNPTVLNNLANVRFGEDRYQEAEALYRRSLELAPENPKTLYNLGLVLFRLGRPREAVSWLEKVMALDPGLAPAVDLHRRAVQAARMATPSR